MSRDYPQVRDVYFILSRNLHYPVKTPMFIHASMMVVMKVHPTHRENRNRNLSLRPCGFYADTSGVDIGSPAKQKQKLLAIPTLKLCPSGYCLSIVFL